MIEQEETSERCEQRYIRRGRDLLDSAHEKLRLGMARLGMDEMVLGLRRLRNEDGECWRRFIEEHCRRHPITALLGEDPLTQRSLTKPRGYPGDPEMLDFIFGSGSLPPGTSDLGASIFSYTTDGPAPRSVRARAGMIAHIIDDLSLQRPIRVLAVMAGHLWEAGLSEGVRQGRVEKYVAFDQDARTLASIDAAGYGSAVTTYQGTLRSLFRGKSVFRNFDLVYSGLTDNLPDATASRFIGALFDAVAPGGRLIVSNFCPELVDAGYMEAFMDWSLIYRTEEELAALTSELPADRIASSASYRDPYGNIAFLDLERVEIGR